MEINTDHFGELTIDPEGIISFPSGIPGFVKNHRFVLLQRPEEAPISWLQSLDDRGLTFAVTEPENFLSAYNPRFAPGELAVLGLKSQEEALLLTVLVLSTDPYKTTANLQAPIVINKEKKLGAQLVLSDDWPRRYPILSPESPVGSAI